MTKYNFSVDGIPVAIYPLSEPEEVTKELLRATDDVAIRVALLSDSEVDFRIVCFDKNNTEPREPHIPLAALSCFLSGVRGYPDMSLDVAYRGRIIKLTLDKTKGYNFSVNSEKCKKISTKTVDFLDGVLLTCDVISSPIPCAVLAVEDVLCFDDSRLSLLYSRLRDVGSHSLVIASLNGVLCAKTMGDVTPYEAVRTAVSLLSARGSVLPTGHIEATVNGSLIKFDHTRTGLAFYPEIKYIS